MSEYDDMNNEGTTPENQEPEIPENTPDTEPEINSEPEAPAQMNEPAAPENKNPYSNSYSYGAPTPQQPVNPYSNQGYGNPQQPQGYYPPYSQQPQGKVNYVYSAPYAHQTAVAPAPKASKGKKAGRRVFFTIMSVLIVVAILFCGIAIGRGGSGKTSNGDKIKNEAPVLEIPIDSDKDSENSEAPRLAQGSANADELDPRDIYQKVKDASVGILITSGTGLNTSSGEGSGVIVGEDNSHKNTYIITCAHVVADGGTVKVQLSDESQYDASLVGSDARTDIAVLRIAKTGLSSIEIGDSESLEVGETVYAIGNPGGVGFAGSFTNGMISSIARPIQSEIGYQMTCIQHTAAINPGNSGGALVNAKGQLIGINSSKIASTDYEGMGFAVPSSTFVKVYNEIIAHGYVTDRPKLGIRYVPAVSNTTYAMLVSANNLPNGSIVIASIDVDSPLASKDVQSGDLIIACNGVELEDTDYLPDLVEKSKVGDKLTLTVVRFDNNYKMTKFDVEVSLIEDRGTVSQQVEEPTTQDNSYYYFDPFDFFGNGN
jgi:serine protease Do